MDHFIQQSNDIMAPLNAMAESLKLGPDSRREEFSVNLPAEFHKLWKMTEN